MKFDKNTVIGFSLLGVLFVAFFWINSRDQKAYQAQQLKEKVRLDSIAKLQQPKVDLVVAKIDSIKADSASRIAKAGDFQGAINGTEKLTIVESDLLKITFTNKGGRPKFVELKNFKTH